MSQESDIIKSIDNATTVVSNRIDAINARLAAALAAGQTPDPADLAALTAISARLVSLGQDPSNPVPPDPTPIPAPVAPAPTT